MERRDRGFALLIVTITLAVLSLIFAAALATSRQHLAATMSQMDRLQASAAADGAFATAERDLITASTAPPLILSAPETILIGGGEVRVSVRREATKLDLNAISLPFLERYLIAAGASVDAARSLVSAVAARRKLADLTGTVNRYEHHEDQRFQTVSELADIKGVDDELFGCIAPDLTVFTGATLPSPDGASQNVRVALGLPPNAHQQPSTTSVASGRAIVSGEVFEITADAKIPGYDTHLVKEVIVRVTGNRKRPVWILAESTPSLLNSQQACERLKVGEKRAANAD